MYKALTSLSGGVVPGGIVDTTNIDAANIARLTTIGAIALVEDVNAVAAGQSVNPDDLSHLDDDSDESPTVAGVEKRGRGRPRINR